MDFKDLKVDDLVCIYQCVDREISHFQLYSLPDTLNKYWNQLNKCCSVLHSEILKKEREFEKKNVIIKE